MSCERARLVAQAIVADDYAEFIAACAEHCRCCPSCTGTPCEGCCGGGVCDQFRCTCNDDLCDEDDGALDWDDPAMDFEP